MKRDRSQSRSGLEFRLRAALSLSLLSPPPPSREQLSDWLQKCDSHPIVELSYLEVGLGSQSIHMQFGEGGAAYTLLVRDSLRCKRFFGLLTGKRGT